MRIYKEDVAVKDKDGNWACKYNGTFLVEKRKADGIHFECSDPRYIMCETCKLNPNYNKENIQ